MCVFVVVATQNNPSNNPSQKAASDLASFLHYVNSLRSKSCVIPDSGSMGIHFLACNRHDYYDVQRHMAWPLSCLFGRQR